MNVYEIVTERVLSEIKSAQENGKKFYWIKPWSVGCCLPVNYDSCRRYKGINLLLLEPGEYLTFNSIKKHGAKLRRGAKAKPVVFYNVVTKKNKDGTPKMVEIDGKEVEDKYFTLKYYNVFRLEDVEGLESKFSPDTFDFEETDVTAFIDMYVDCYCKAEGLEVRKSESCWYRDTGEIGLVARNRFSSDYEYYSSVLHELIHSTSKGLGRNLGGGETYCREELIAEIGAQMLLALFGLEDTEGFKNNSAYIAGWAKYLADSNKEIVKASFAAERAVNYLIEQAEKAGAFGLDNKLNRVTS